MFKYIAGGLAVAAVLSVGLAVAAEAKGREAKQVQVTYAVHGLLCEGCIGPLQKALGSAEGVKSSKVLFKENQAVVTYDAARTDVGKLAQVAAAAKNMEEKPFDLGLLLALRGVSTEGAASNAAKALESVEGVKKAEVKFHHSLASVWFNDNGGTTLAQLQKSLQDAGYRSAPWKAEAKPGSHGSHEPHESCGSSCGMHGGGCG